MREVTNVTRKLIIALLAGTVSAGAVSAAEGPQTGRYTMHKSDDGFVRLDTQTGVMSLCRKRDGGWACDAMAGTGQAGSGELARLRRENAELKAEIKRMEEHLGLRGDPAKPARKSSDFKLPTEKEVDQALDYFERMLKKFQDRLKRLERNSETPERQL